jgi:hypothetical protein
VDLVLVAHRLPTCSPSRTACKSENTKWGVLLQKRLRRISNQPSEGVATSLRSEAMARQGRMPASWRTHHERRPSPRPSRSYQNGEMEKFRGLGYPGWRSFLIFGSQPPREGCPKREVRSANGGPGL